jgi:hypothetical protein
MQIFVTDPCPIKSAYNLDDRRVNKMIIESCQLLSTAIRLCYAVSKQDDENLYKTTHENHPIIKWLICDDIYLNVTNASWLQLHLKALSQIYQTNTGKIHASYLCRKNIECFISTATTPPVSFCDCSGYDLRQDWSVFQRYQRCLIAKWQNDKHHPKFRNREIPWFYSSYQRFNKFIPMTEDFYRKTL